MYKSIKKIIKIVAIVLGSLLAFTLVLLLSLQLRPVQNYLAQRTVQYLSTELHAKVSLGSIYIKPFRSIVLKDLELFTPQGQPILKSGTLKASVDLSAYLDYKRIIINELTLENTVARYEQFADSTNIDFLLRYFSAPKKEKKKPTKTIQWQLHELILKNNAFTYINHTQKHYAKVVDFGDLDIKELNAHFDQIKLDSTTLSTHIKGLSLKEKKGLQIKGLQAQAIAEKRKIELKNLFLTTNRSTLKNYVRLDYTSFNDFSDFITKVKVTLNARDSRIHSEDIAFFSTPMHRVRFDVQVKHADLSGTVSDIHAQHVNLRTGKETQLLGDLRIIGLPDIDNTDFRLPKIAITSSYADLNQIIPQLADLKNFKLPPALQPLDKMSFKGALKGKYNNFKIDGQIKSNLGMVTAERANLDIRHTIQYAGLFSSTGFALNKLLQLPEIGSTGFNLQVNGAGLDPATLKIDLHGSLKNVNFRNYTYRDIQLEASLQQRLLKVKGDIRDPHIGVAFLADVDWSTPSSSYQLTGEIRHADLYPLHLFRGDSVQIEHTQFRTSLIGSSLNNIVGSFTSDSLSFTSSKGKFAIHNIDFQADGTEENRMLSLNSDVATVNLEGRIDLNTVVPYFRELAMNYAPAIGFEKKQFNKQDFDLDIAIKSFSPIATFFRKDITLDSGATLTAKFNSEQQSANFNFFAPSLKYAGIRFNNLIVDQNANENNMELQTSIDRINLSDSTYINNVNIGTTLAHDSLLFNVKMSELDASNNLDLNGVIRFAHERPAYITFYPSTIRINSAQWGINSDTPLKISKGRWHFDNLILSYLEQKVKLNGILSNNPEDKINIDFDDFNLSSLNGITKPLGINLLGKLNGNVEVNSLLQSPFIVANIQTSPILYNNIPIGQLHLKANYDQEQQVVKINGRIEEGEKRIQIDGDYKQKEPTNKLQLQAQIKKTDAILFQPFLKDLVSNIKGKVNADLSIEGDILRPKISGRADFENVSLNINYLKTPYRFTDKVVLVSNSIFLNNLKIRDPQNHEATINGLVDLNKLSDPKIDVEAKANNFLILNTTAKDNSLYYGTAYASGSFRFKGLTSAMNIDIQAKSEENTIINIPFNSAMTVTDNDFIYFIEPDSTKYIDRSTKKDFNGLTMNMDLNITPNAEINLFTSMGELTGKGNSNLNMRISSLGDFEMFGDFVIASGKFNFTAQDYINKIFDLKEGGTIRWAGNPAEANINLSAIYQQRTSLAPLYNAAGREQNPERVLAQADMILKGQLNQPDITFDLNFPQNPGVKDELQSYLSDVNNVNQQALSLIIRRSFTPGSQTDFGKEVNNTLLSAGTEIAFNQINNIIAQSLNVNFFDINIKSLNDASASLRLFNDRLILTGGISDRRNEALTDLNVFSDRVSTDAEALFYLRKDGRLVLRASNRLNTRNFLLSPNDGEYISAFGLLYRQEFNSFSEFLRRLFPIGKNKLEVTEKQ